MNEREAKEIQDPNGLTERLLKEQGFTSKEIEQAMKESNDKQKSTK